MRSGSSLPAAARALAALAVLAAVPAGAQGTGSAATAGARLPPPSAGSSCLFVGPLFGTDVIDIGWSLSPSYLGGVAPGVRAGLWLHDSFIAGEAGVHLEGAPGPTGYGQLQLKVGAVYGHDIAQLGPLHAYGLGGLDVDLQAGTSGGSSFAFPLFGLTLGAGLQYPVNDSWTLGGEVGLHTLVDVGPSTGVATGLFVSVVGSWSLPGGPCGDHPGTVSPPDVPKVPPDDHPPLIPPDFVTYDDSYRVPCSAYVTDGWMEPTQDVWQDDLGFDDRAGKQLTRLDGDAVAYQAELPMASRKPTLLFGAHHYVRGGAPVVVDSRDFIVLSGLTNCSVAKPVKMRFTLTGAGPPKELWTSPEVAQVKLAGTAQNEYEPWTVRLPVRAGVPPDHAFTIDGAGGYQVRAELLDEGNPTGLMMTVGGDAKVMTAPAVHFVPVLLTKVDEAGEADLISKTEALEKDSASKVPDVFPIPPGGLVTSTRVVRNLIDQQVPDRWFQARRVSYVVAALNDSLAASTFLDGAGRVVAVLSRGDFQAIFGKGFAGMTVSDSVEVRKRGSSARTLSWKVMLVPSHETWETVAHELLHTLPEGWAEDEMKAECGKAYHNTEDALASGERITLDGAENRDRKVALVSVMGPWEPSEKIWMDQCTYWHLTKMLAGAPPDPPVMMVRALLGTRKGKPIGELRPVYELMGTSDLTATKSGGPYAFVLKSAQGAQLARFPFNPRSSDIETREKLEVMSFVGRVPIVPGWASLELQGPGGAVLDKKVRSETPPQVAITAPRDGEQVAVGKVKVRWTAKPATPALTLLSSVLYSSDRGAHWTDQAFEQPISELDVALSPKATEHLVKVVTTDGTRSAEAVIRLRTGPAPAPKPGPGK